RAGLNRPDVAVSRAEVESSALTPVFPHPAHDPVVRAHVVRARPHHAEPYRIERIELATRRPDVERAVRRAAQAHRDVAEARALNETARDRRNRPQAWLRAAVRLR